MLAACHELALGNVYRAGGAAAVAAMAFGTQTIPRVDKIVGPGNTYVQLAKRLLAGAVERAGVYTKDGVPRVSSRIGIMEAVA